jgi:predicted phage terminase large subunit-like protein
MLEKNPDKYLFLLPRGHLKSYIITSAYSIWCIIKNPNIRIGICANTTGLAKEHMRLIKRTFESNVYLKAMYPDIFYQDPQNEAPKWTESEIAVKRNGLMRESTVETFGLDPLPTGHHYDLIVYDDIVTPESVATLELMKKTKELFGFSLSLLEPHGKRLVAGTRYHFGDLYSELIDSGTWSVYLRKAIENNIPIFPQKFTLEKLQNIKEEQGSYIFSSQYLLDPITSDKQDFKPEWVKYYTESPKGLFITITVDPAITVHEKSDYSAIVTCGTDWNDNVYVLEASRGKWNSRELVDRIIEVAKRYDCVCVGIESVGFQRMLYDDVRDKGLYAVELKPDTRTSKRMKILGLQPRFERGKIFIKKEMTELEDELLHFPYCKHDDLIDALSMHLLEDMCRAPGDEPTREPNFPQRQNMTHKKALEIMFKQQEERELELEED